MSEKLLEVRDLSVKFKTVNGLVNALNGVSFDILRNESVGFVGESGCGKSVTARAVMRILEKNSVMTGDVKLFTDNQEIMISAYKQKDDKLRSIRGGKISMIFQEPMSSLCPVYTVGNQLIEAIRLHSDKTKKEAREIAIEYLANVGISRPSKLIDEYPYQLSGGMRQRVVIAMALSCNPELLIADEPTTALDVTVSAQILKLLEELREKHNMSVMMINHNLGVIAQTCSRVFVMYLGRIVEAASVDEIFDHPMHPYTIDLLNSIPRLNMARGGKLARIRGYVPDPLNIPKGCAYHNRCRSCVKGTCDECIPEMVEVRPGHYVACSCAGEV
ncbi:MAG: ABC transporter ATP-binding protein [Clostridia bacterium]|nr:ABC transporter ATP-binding protein [Clostridia bacterium]